MTDRTEQLIREAFAAEADRAPDSRAIMAELARARPPRRRHTALFAATAAIVAVALAAVVVPALLHRTTPAAGPQDENVLLMGLNRSKKAELFMLAHLDADGTASVVTLPDGMPRGDGSSYGLADAYRTFGADRVLDDVGKLTGVHVDHYAALDTGLSFPAGTHTVAGARALDFLRQNNDTAIPYPDFVERQTAFLTGLASKAGAADPRKVLDVLGKHLRTDKGLDVLGLVSRIASARGVRFISIYEGLDMPMNTGKGSGRGDIVIPLVSVKTFVTDMFAGKAYPGGPHTPELKFTKQTCVF
jgi:hypothetical protein